MSLELMHTLSVKEVQFNATSINVFMNHMTKLGSNECIYESHHVFKNMKYLEKQ